MFLIYMTKSFACKCLICTILYVTELLEWSVDRYLSIEHYVSTLPNPTYLEAISLQSVLLTKCSFLVI